MASVPACIEFLGEVETTMEVARGRMPAYAGKPFGIVAESQMAGRGSGDRAWISPRGNLYFTICIPQNSAGYMNPELVPVLSLVCGLACRSAIVGLLPELPPSMVTLKWPNDIICGRKKIGGSIVESEGGYFILGFGINLDVAPAVADAGRDAAALNDVATTLGLPKVDPARLAHMIWEFMFHITTDPVMTRAVAVAEFERLMDRDLKLHRRTAKGRDPEELVAVSLNEWGHLKVRHADGREEELSAEYLF